jgi:hypothetical protein
MASRAPGINNIVAKRAYERPLLALDPTLSESVRRIALCDPPVDGYLLDGVLSAAECRALVAALEAVAPEEGGFSFWGDASSREANRRLRSADTLEARQPALAAELWARMRVLAAEPVEIVPGDERFECDLEGTWEAVGLNEHLLFARYGPGGHFAPHADGQTELDFNTRSLFSVILYLNDCAEGGATRILTGEQADATERRADGMLVARPGAVAHIVAPVAGRALAFYQAVLHDGQPVGAGACKYIVRTDIIYARREPLCTAEEDVRAYALYQRARDEESSGRSAEAAELFRRAFKTSRAIARIYGG